MTMTKQVPRKGLDLLVLISGPFQVSDYRCSKMENVLTPATILFDKMTTPFELLNFKCLIKNQSI